jgi:hypothetical protein
MAWWELVLPLGVCMLFILIFKFTVETAQTTDTEYHGGILVSARYYEYYETWVSKMCSYDCNCTTDKDGHTSCQTCWKDCSYCDPTSARWVATNSIGETFSISEEYYKYLRKRWSSPEKFVELNRNINFHGDCGKDGDAYDIFWDKDPMTAVSTTTEHNYENKVQATHSAFDFVKVTKEDVQTYSLFKYPKVKGFTQDNVLGLDSLNWLREDEKNKFLQMTQYLNGKLGPEKHARIYWLFFRSKPPMAALMQEAYWDGGNDNELVICIGLSPSSRNIEWVKPFSWTPNKEILVDIREEIMMYHRFDVDTVLAVTHRNILSTWKRKDFKEFNYLTVDIPTWAKWVIWILTLLITGGICYWNVKNGFEADPDNPIKTITRY